jgi:hypothetical protein
MFDEVSDPNTDSIYALLLENDNDSLNSSSSSDSEPENEKDSKTRPS